MLKRDRQKRILNLIRARPIRAQDAILAHLQLSGVPATLSSVSRDLEELGVIKYRGRYVLPRVDSYPGLVNPYEGNLEEAEHRIVECKRNRSREIDLSGLELRRLPESVRELTWLKVLDVNSNEIRKIP